MTIDNKLVRGLYGSKLSKDKVVGYCRYHNAHLTITTLKQHKCLGKCCNALKKHEHEYWEQRELLKIRKKENKIKRS